MITVEGAGSGYLARGRLPASELKKFKTDGKEIALNTTAAGATTRIIYGRKAVPGDIFAFGLDGTELVVGVAWCLGEIKRIEQVFINDELMPANIKMRHYRGTPWQKKDGILAAAVLLYDDTLVLEKATGTSAIAYSVFKIPTTELDNAPRFQAIIQGKVVNDPRDTNNGDVFYDDVGVSVHFTGDNGDTSATDESSHGHTITFVGDTDIQDNQADFDGTGDTISIADHVSLRPGSGAWSLEMKVTPGSITGVQPFFLRDGFISQLGILIGADGADLKVGISSNGTSYDIMDVTKTDALAIGTEIDIKLEYDDIDGVYILWTDGNQGNRSNSTDVVNENSKPHVLGTLYTGKIRCYRFTKNLRYGGQHLVDSVPFTDTDSYVTGNRYSDNPALCWADLCASSVYGLGAAVNGLDDVADWCDELIGGTVPRCRISLDITKPKKTESYLDLIATYGEFFYTYEGSAATVYADKPVGVENPSGQEIVENGSFDVTDTGWTKGTNWFATAGFGFILVAPGAESKLSQTLTTEDGVKYAITMVLDSRTAGTVAVDFGGVEQIAAQTVPGTYTALVTATGTSNALDIVANSAFVGSIASISVKRLYWRIDRWVKDSVSIEGVSNNDSPTKIRLTYTAPDDDTATWPEASVTYELPGVATSDLPLIETTLSMEGVYRQEEALIKAEARGRRLQNRVRFSGICTDIGLLFHRGMVIEPVLPSRGVGGLLVLVDKVDQIAYGRYRVSGLRYDGDNHYPDSLPVGAGTIPVGAITLMAGNDLPAGWELYEGVSSGALGKFIVGAGDGTGGTYAVDATGGSATHAGFSGNTDDGGAHIPDETNEFNVPDRIIGTETLFDYTPDAGTLEKGEHAHTYSTGTITPNLYRREAILMKKITSTATTFPVEAMVFGIGGLAVANLVRSTAFQNQILQAANAHATDGATAKFVSLTTGSFDDVHQHHTKTLFNNQQWPAYGSVVTWREPEPGGGPHTHSFLGTLTRNPKVYRLALYGGTDDFTVSAGMMIFWDGAVTGLPTDWYLCDGQNETPDLRNYMIEIAANGSEDTSAGDNTIDLAGDTNIVKHRHDDAEDTDSRRMLQVAHRNESHRHGISASGSWTPPYYALAVLMYNP